ncbi:heme peroxidase [Hyaloraphidium curvatum]|nr:heme peroxidase [Hyaloraphidium curvatum]
MAPGKLTSLTAAFAVIALLVNALGANALGPIPSQQLVAGAKASLRTLVLSNRQSFVPGFVRLGFHDCVSAKCDGCINVNAADNRGLDTRVSALNNLYDGNATIKAGMSRADFWMLAMVVATEVANNGGVPGLAMRFGRDDSTNCPGSEANVVFPAAHGNGPATFAFFNLSFGFTAAETTALLGMHSLGRVLQANSGFNFGPWVQGQGQVPTNLRGDAYYRNMVQRPWTQTDATPNGAERHWQWTNRGSNSGFLNADVGIFKSFTTQANGRASCTRFGGGGGGGGGGNCPDAATAGAVRNFANNNAAWLSAVGPVLTKMMERGYPANTLVTVAGATAALNAQGPAVGGGGGGGRGSGGGSGAGAGSGGGSGSGRGGGRGGPRGRRA